MPKTVKIKGSILTSGSEWLRDYGYEVTTPKDITDALESANGDDVEIIINSPGGYTSAASEIYTAVRSYTGNVVAKIVGYACSAASWVAMGANRIEISPVGLIMIHNSRGYVTGDNRDMESASDMLKSVDQSIRNAIKAKTGKSDDEIKDLMNKETWFTAEEAIKNNLVDEIMFDTEPGNLSLNDLQMPTAKVLKMIMSKNKKEEEEEVGDKNKKVEDVKLEEVKNEDVPAVDNSKDIEVTAEMIKNNFQNIYDEIFNAGVEAERLRIKNIEDVAIPGFEELTNKAKFEESTTAEEYAMNILKAQKNAGDTFIKNMEEDKKDVNVEPDNENSKNEEKEALINAIANAANKRK